MDTKKYVNDNTTVSDRKINTPSSFARKNLSFVQEVGTLKSLKAHSSIRENMDSYLMFICLEGAGEVSVNGKIYSVNAGDVVFLDCHKHYEHTSSAQDPWKIKWVHYTGGNIKAMFELFSEGNKSIPVFTPENSINQFDELMDAISGGVNSKSVMEEIAVSRLLEDLTILALKQVVDEKELMSDSMNQLDNDDFSSLRESVNEHCEDDSLLRILSIQYGLAEDKLSNLFEMKYGISIDKYIVNRRFNKAKELLRFTIKPVDEIIDESGIKDAELFKKLFMDNEEMTPEDYRKKWAQWIKS